MASKHRILAHFWHRGLASYYEVLEAEQLLYLAEFSLSQTSRDRRLVVVQLYKALGGSWTLDDIQFANGH